MRNLLVALVLFATPVIANAGFVVEASGGRGAMIAPDPDMGIGNTIFMIAPGYGLGEVIRAQVGVAWDAPEDGAPSNFRLRPMLTIDPPIFPAYARLIFGVTNLTGDGDMQYEMGGAVGIGGSIAGIGLFAEVGVIPQFVEGERYTFLEGRGGVMLAF